MMPLVYALASALFAALTTVLAKLGLEGINSTLATAIRTVVILFMSWDRGFDTSELELFNPFGHSDRCFVALLF